MRPVLFAASFLLPLVVATTLVIWSRMRQTRMGLKATNVMVRTADLSTPHNRDAPLSMALAVIPLFATAWLLTTRWSSIPERFPVHWGFDGQPNRWVERGPLSVFGLLVAGVILIVLFVAVEMMIDRSSPGFAGRARMLQVKRNALTGAAWFLSLIFSAAAGLPLIHDPTKWIPLFVIGSLAGSLLLIATTVFQAVRIPDKTIAASNRATEQRFWRAGIFYTNAADPAVWVPKRSGLGYTLNFGQPAAWIILAVILLIVLIVPFALHTSRHP